MVGSGWWVGWSQSIVTRGGSRHAVKWRCTHREQPSVHPEGGKTLRVFPSCRGWYGWVGENVEEGVQCGRFGGEMGGG